MVDTALIDEVAALPKRAIVGRWIANHDKHGREVGQKLACSFAGSHPGIGLLILNLTILGGAKSSAQMSLTTPGRRTRTPIYRIDLATGRHHSNPLREGDADSGRIFGPDEDHIHDYADCREGERPDAFARSTPAEIVDLRSAVEHLSIRFNITNPNDIPDPPAQGILL